MTNRIQAAASVFFRITLGLVFIYAAIDKIADPYIFAVDIRNYQIIPDALSNILAVLLPWIELICGISLITGFYIRSSALLIASMLVIFIIAIILAVIRGLNIDCGCYHTLNDSAKVSYQKLIEDFIYFIMSVYLIFTKNLGPVLDNFLNKE